MDPSTAAEIARMPQGLRALLEAELAAGNAIVEVGHSFPAPPVGASFLLAKPVTTCARATHGEFQFRDRQSSSCSGEFTDATRHFFILEPPLSPPPPPDMDAIREAMSRAGHTPPGPPSDSRGAPKQLSLVDRFRASMNLDYEKWREGTSYAIELIDEATPDERREIEGILLRSSTEGWREVEALARLGTPTARKALKRFLQAPNAEVRMAVIRHAPELVPKRQRIDALVRGIEAAEVFGGLSETLDEAAEFHPPEVIDALLRGVLERKGSEACLFAALLLYIHGKTSCRLGMEERPFWIRINTEDPVQRKALFNELCQRIRVSPT